MATATKTAGKSAKPKKKAAKKVRARRTATGKTSQPAKKTARKAAPRKKTARNAAAKKNKLSVKNSLVNNINARKKKGKSRPKSKSTIAKDAYEHMQDNWGK